jgi:hypothetical protein
VLDGVRPSIFPAQSFVRYMASEATLPWELGEELDSLTGVTDGTGVVDALIRSIACQGSSSKLELMGGTLSRRDRSSSGVRNSDM